MGTKTKTTGFIFFYIFIITACKKDKAPETIKDESGSYTVTTLAGDSLFGYAEGMGAAAKFNYPISLAVDASNNVYVADRNNNRIRKISPANVVTTYAGTGVAGGADGNISSAQFDMPRFIAFDPGGNLFVIDSMRLRLRKITPSGVVTTVNSNRNPGYADGPLSTAQFGSLDDLAIDATGSIFIIDGVNSRIRKINSSGVVSTVAGSGDLGYLDGDAFKAKFMFPTHIAVDGQNNVFVRDNFYIRKISSGNVTTIATVGDPNSPLGFVSPSSMKVDSQGTIYVGVNQSFTGSYLAKLSATGSLVKIAGGIAGYTDGSGSAAKIISINYMTLNQNGTIYFIDEERIRKVTKN